MALVVQQVAVKQRLTLLGQAQRVVDFIARLARHHAAQILHVGRRYFHVHHEIGAGKTEQHQQIVFAKQRRVDHQLGALCPTVFRRVTGGVAGCHCAAVNGRLGMQNGQRKGEFIETVDQLANDVTTLVAKEQPGEHLDLKVGAQFGIAQVLHHRVPHQAAVMLQIVKRALQVKVHHHLHQHAGHGFPRGVVGMVGWALLGLIVLDVLGAGSRAHKNEIVLKIAAVQYFGRHRVKKGLRQLGLVVVHQQPDVVQLDLLPYIHAELASLEFAF